MGPTEGHLTPSVAISFVLARSASAAIAIDRVVAAPPGFSFRLSVEPPVGGELEIDDGHLILSPAQFAPAALPLPPELLRVGVEFSDGRLATNVEGIAYQLEERPDGPLLVMGGGSAGRSSCGVSVSVTPLPPPGRLRFSCEWPIHDIPFTVRDVDGDLLRAQAARSRSLWP